MVKRQLPIVIVIVVGFLSLGGHFINNAPLKNFIDNDATQWYDIIAGFAVFLGSLNLLKLHLTRISRKTKNWEYSIFSVLGFFIMIIFGFVYHGSDTVQWGKHLDAEDSYFYWMIWHIYTPLSSTMFALLAFFVASASYRAFRIRNYEATLLLASGIILMLGRVPIGSLIPWWIVGGLYISLVFALLKSYLEKNILSYSFVTIYAIFVIIGNFIFRWDISPPLFLQLNAIQEWIFDVPATAGAIAIMVGIAIGTIAQSYRIITGRERSILG